MTKYLYLIGSCILFFSCSRKFEATLPDTAWELFDSPAATRLASFTRTKTEGVYTLEQGADAFGPLTAAKWSY